MHFVACRPMVTTDSVGRFEIRALRAGVCSVTAANAGYRNLTGEPRPVAESDVRRIRFEMGREP